MAGEMTQSLAGEAEIARLEQLFRAPDQAGSLFSKSFLAAVSGEQVRQIVEQMIGSVGPPRAIVEDGDGYAVETASHTIPIRLTLDGDGLIDELLFEPPVALTASIEETLDRLGGLADTVSYIVETAGTTRFERDADRPLAVGSTFKLGVLKGLVDDIAAGSRHWEDVARLEATDRSLPSGDLRLYPTGSPFTLHTLAAEMIARSDNTATDMLIRVVGADRIADTLGIDTLLTTRALFQFKADKALSETYLAGSPQERAAVIRQLAGRDLPSVEAASGPYIPDVEWMIPARQLCRLANAVADTDVFAINPGPIRPKIWQSVAYKGGSETGVLNLTAALTGRDGRRHCLSVTLNDGEAIDEATAAGLFARAAGQLAAAK
ncbi:MAG: hypothetical protein H6Q99_3215 [Proteobacteria bacterium]|nr:hypothetical protein [Pseudomonadota bacterium]